ncbi:MAG TPA: twin-arginine translocase TatA/TatE family subunit [bacterium]|nr:twin-arginine translocase TatA/TatE family subunit [bacterium]
MFDNPEKLFILFVIALLIFGPSKLASLGASLGRSIRDFRSTVRGAHDEFRTAMQDHLDTATGAMDSAVPELPAPEPAPDETAAAGMHDGAAPDYAVSPDLDAPPPAAAAVPDDDPSSLASEPTAAALRESLSR